MTPVKHKQLYNWPILGHSHIVKFLQTCITRDSLSHAYLFHGQKYTGKFLTTTFFSSSILCQSSNKIKPCGSCSSCQQLKRNIHPDLTLLTPEEDKKNISIEQIRNLQHVLSLRSFLTSYKIAIIDNADSMTEAAANALLKTLEEPPPKTILILIAESLTNLPRTIVSRCQTIQFNVIATEKITNWLTSQGKSKREAQIIARYANGRIGKAEILSSNDDILNSYKDRVKLLLEIIQSNTNQKFAIINSMLPKQITLSAYGEINSLLDDWLTLFRDIFLAKNNKSLITNFNLQDTLVKISDNYSYKKLIHIINNIIRSKKLIKYQVSPKLIFENLALSL